ncbi:sulfur carrier protein ThiS [Desulfurivibrio alkaliphilus]|uniref:Thiamine biosynthesis protein ThiS n=1 Tax=Desulfurivibrio alkaliphilus (strain DSM 19089 / UNIQEM U267 / AHT2) TaxID=589865 RepID=D6Z3J3_DESAT|nr:sulfur carrier protein ThiS [Desulfurivibrio alkaliphilus]ADH86118.1 thiamine biosynthesis protein ThiS [Desulfurivibrio alkaliphilus AHT 2]
MDNSTDRITITCNGQPRQVAAGSTVATLIRDLALEPQQVAAELDGRVLNPEELAVTELSAGARLELIRFVGGG